MQQLSLEDINDYYLEKRFQGTVKEYTHTAELNSKSNYLRVTLVLDGFLIKEIKFTSDGSVLTQGLMEFMCESIQGKDVGYAFRFDPLRYINFDIMPGRADCANLPHRTVKEAIRETYQRWKKTGKRTSK